MLLAAESNETQKLSGHACVTWYVDVYADILFVLAVSLTLKCSEIEKNKFCLFFQNTEYFEGNLLCAQWHHSTLLHVLGKPRHF